MGSIKELLQCLACGGSNLDSVLDLGNQPLANAYLTDPTDDSVESSLEIMMCQDCTHCQLAEAVDPSLLYKDYKYVSGTTQTLKEHFANLAIYIRDDLFKPRMDRPVPIRALDIGCNDGTMLEIFDRFYGFHTQGVDPAENLRKESEAKGIKVLVDFWNSETAHKLVGEFNVITALNCLAHNSDPFDFLKGCKRVLSADGVIIIEFPYFKETVKRKDLGQFYAEHHSYFTARSFLGLVERLDLHVFDVRYFKDIHGGTVRFVLKRCSLPHCQQLRDLILEEEGLGSLISELESDINKNVLALSREIHSQSKIKSVVAYGASAKSSTLFNLPTMSSAVSRIECVVDDNPNKQGLFCPGSGLEIMHPNRLKELDECGVDLAIVLTVHNFKAEVLRRLRESGLGGRGHVLINYTPEVSVEEI